MQELLEDGINGMLTAFLEYQLRITVLLFGACLQILTEKCFVCLRYKVFEEKYV